MGYLCEEEFTAAERNDQFGEATWPDWHHGVLSMYGSAMALNHLSGSNQMNVVKLNYLIDFPSSNTLNPNQKIHIHAFHTWEVFSKFAFKENKYDNMTVADKDLDKINYYCLKMALDSKRIAPADLNKMLNQVTSPKKMIL
jgi:hypothetical protein